VSLDDSPFSCWPVFGGRVRFVNAVEGTHTLVAMLMKDGVLREETRTDVRKFTTVEDPDLGLPEPEPEDEEEEIDLDEKEDKQVELDVPFVEILTPFEKVTLPGSNAEFVSKIHTNEAEKFEKYFKHQFICFNLDASSAHSCWPIFSGPANIKPFVAGIQPGLHTLEALLTHPETRRGIEETQTEFRTFFTSGDSDEMAAVVAQVEVDEVLYNIPVSNGGDAEMQGFYFCGLRGVSDERCVGMVKAKIEAEFLQKWEEAEADEEQEI